MITMDHKRESIPSAVTASGKALKGLTLFFPCYNEEANVATTVRAALDVARQVAEDYEVLVIDDGSRDKTVDTAEAIAKVDPHVRVVRRERNGGYGEALKSGFAAGRFPWIFFSDADGQFNLRELVRAVEKAREADVVIGFRKHRADPWHRKMNALIFKMALYVFMGLRVRDVDCAFKLFKRDVFSRVRLKTTGAMISAEILSKARKNGFSIAEVGVEHLPRKAGSSTGANPRVILRAMREFWVLWWDLRFGAR